VKKADINPKDLIRLYFEEGLSTLKLARKFGVGPTTIRRHFGYAGVSLPSAVETLTKHGMTDTPEYIAWMEMRRRCLPKHWKGYADRGIKVCSEWQNDFQAFFSYIGPKPSPKHSVDRYPNNDGNYEPGNVRWATAQQQARNKRDNRSLTINGETKLLCEWAEQIGVRSGAIQLRLHRGWNPERAVFVPMRITKLSKKKV